MTVSIRVFQDGKVIKEEIYAGKKIQKLIDYLDENNISYRTDMECEKAYGITKDNNRTIMCIDNTNLLNVEGTANFISEYVLEYDEKVHVVLKKILTEETISIGGHNLTSFQFKKLLSYMDNSPPLYDIVNSYKKDGDIKKLERYFSNYVIIFNEHENSMSIADRNEIKPYIKIPIE